MTRDRAIELAKKLYSLARRGVAGEALNAQRQLLLLAENFSLIPEEFGAGIIYEKKAYILYFNQKTRQIFFQTIFKVTGLKKLSYTSFRGSRTKVEINLYPHEYVEIKRLYTIYHNAYIKELKKLEKAFIYANNIYSDEKSVEKPKELTPEEQLELWETLKMASGITPEKIYKQLE